MAENYTCSTYDGHDFIPHETKTTSCVPIDCIHGLIETFVLNNSEEAKVSSKVLLVADLVMPINITLFSYCTLLKFVRRSRYMQSTSSSPRNFNAIASFRSVANFFVPQIPISQSSAYLTYLTFVYSGFGIIDLYLFLSFKSPRNLSFSPMNSNPLCLSICIFFFSLLILVVML